MSVRVDPSNVETAAAWDGPSGDLWADNADHFDTQSARYLPALLTAAAVTPGARVLDVGCGVGRTTREIARLAVDGPVTGIDLSTRMLDLARSRAERDGLTNIAFEQADAQIADLGTDRYDRIVSRNGVMFFGDPVAAFTNFARALAPDGRMVLSVWQSMAENEWFREFRAAAAAGRDIPMPPPAAPGPFSLGDPERLRSVLTAAGFAEPELADVREPISYGDLAAAEAVVGAIVAGLLNELDDEARAGAVAALRESLAAHLGPGGVTYDSAVWIVTARRAR